MRLWSLHPRYLDAKGLVALWREALLAKAVLAGRTTGYRRHPQLERFRAAADPREAIRRYLEAVLEEAHSRGYRFDGRKLGPGRGRRGADGRGSAGAGQRLPVTRGQLEYERQHLLRKLAARDPTRRDELKAGRPELHPLFYEIEGDIEPWEVAARR